MVRISKNYFLALTGKKKGVESADGTNVPNSFYDFESEPIIFLCRVKIKCWNFLGEHKSDNNETTIPRCSLVLFYAFKMTVAIAFLRENAGETLWKSIFGEKNTKVFFLQQGLIPGLLHERQVSSPLDHESSDKKNLNLENYTFY